ncbi:hypothetical protein, partial [Xanthomonas campestris]|uniref:hypothetical protein n=1 Tax=Xanthomonas campestris TaxID=339 RepID=UPI00265C1D4B
CSVSRDGERARALQQTRRSFAQKTNQSTPFNHLSRQSRAENASVVLAVLEQEHCLQVKR